MRPGKRERLVLFVAKRNRRKAKRNAIRETLDQAGNDKPSVTHNSLVARNGLMAMPVGSVSTGSNLLRYERNKDKPKYVIEREPRLSSRPVKSEQKQRFGTL